MNLSKMPNFALFSALSAMPPDRELDPEFWEKQRLVMEEQDVAKAALKRGRNALCMCGSGVKTKKCCGKLK